MFSVQQKRAISSAVQAVLRSTGHPELPEGEISFLLHVEGSSPYSWADIRNNGAVLNPGVNPHNEAQDPKSRPVSAPEPQGDFTDPSARADIINGSVAKSLGKVTP